MDGWTDGPIKAELLATFAAARKAALEAAVVGKILLPSDGGEEKASNESEEKGGDAVEKAASAMKNAEDAPPLAVTASVALSRPLRKSAAAKVLLGLTSVRSSPTPFIYGGGGTKLPLVDRRRKRTLESMVPDTAP